MSLFSKFATVGGATLLSRLLGFGREVMIAAALGAGPVADVFYAAFRFPNLFRRLLAEGAFNAAFVPLFAKELESNGEPQAHRFAEEVLAVLLVVLVALTALAEIFMPYLVGTLIAPHFSGDKFQLTVELTRIMFPYLFAMSLAAMLSGVLNAYRHYFLAAIVPVALNVILIAALVGAYALGATPQTIGRVLAWGVVASGIVQLTLLVVGARKAGFRPRFRIPELSPSVRRLLLLAAPVAITGGITQINLIIGQIIASAQDGAIAVLSYADRIYQLPLGVIGIAIGIVLLPELSRALKSASQSPEHAESDNVHSLQNQSLEFAMALTLPAAVGLALLPDAIINVIYERGAFTADITALTADVLYAFAWGLPAFVLIKVFTPAFFAREDMRTPMWFAGVSVVVNIAGSLWLFPHYGPVGIAIATAVASWVNAIALATTLARRSMLSVLPSTLRRLMLIVFASAIMALSLLGLSAALSEWFTAPTLIVRAGTLGASIAIAASVFFATALATGAIDRNAITSAIVRSSKPRPD